MRTPAACAFGAARSMKGSSSIAVGFEIGGARVAGGMSGDADRLEADERFDQTRLRDRTGGRAGVVESVAVSGAGELHEHDFLHPLGSWRENDRRQPSAKLGMVLTGCP